MASKSQSSIIGAWVNDDFIYMSGWTVPIRWADRFWQEWNLFRDLPLCIQCKHYSRKALRCQSEEEVAGGKTFFSCQMCWSIVKVKNVPRLFFSPQKGTKATALLNIHENYQLMFNEVCYHFKSQLNSNRGLASSCSSYTWNICTSDAYPNLSNVSVCKHFFMLIYNMCWTGAAKSSLR